MSEPASNPPKDKTTELQSKLYQAAKRDPKRRFHALYDKLSLPCILEAAWRAVSENRGAAGIDRQTLEGIEAEGVGPFLAEIAQSLKEKTYRPQPARRIEIPKDDGSTRPLGIPTVRDRVVQAAAKLLLEPIFEADFEGTSFGFRPGLGQHDALEAVYRNSRDGYRWVVDADIRQFFDTLDHGLLMESVRRRVSDGEMLRLIHRWLKAGHLLEGEYHPTDQGSPQGGVLSPLLANIYLHPLDEAAKGQKEFTGRITRYADDFVIQCGTEAQAAKALAWAQERVEALRLKLHPEKTRVVSDREAGFDFLGFHHRRVVQLNGRETRGTLRWPSAKAQRRFRARIRELAGPPWLLRKDWSGQIGKMRRYLQGWVHYFRHGQSSRVFAKLDYFLSERISRNLARSQPTGKKRRKRSWRDYLERYRAGPPLPPLRELAGGRPRPYRGEANVRWRAV